MNLQKHKNTDSFTNHFDESKPDKTRTFHYHPKDIDFTSNHLYIGKIMRRLKDKKINIPPKKRGWSLTKQSRFIESILVRIPLSSFYFDGSDDENWQIVDGLNRLIALNNFAIKQTLRLENLEYLPEYNKMKFNNLPRDLQRRIEETTVPSYILNPGVPSDFKHSIFKRINPKRFK